MKLVIGECVSTDDERHLPYHHALETLPGIAQIDLIRAYIISQCVRDEAAVLAWRR